MMRISVNHKILLVFSSLAVVTIIMGGTVLYSMSLQTQYQLRIQTLNDFKTQIKDLEKYNFSRSGLVEQDNQSALDIELKNALGLVEEIVKFRKFLPLDKTFISEELNGLLDAMQYYRISANELQQYNEKVLRLSDINDQIMQDIAVYEVETPSGVLPIYSDIAKMFLLVENLRDQLEKTHDPKAIKDAKIMQRMIIESSNDPYINELLNDFVLNLENIYISILALHERVDFLSSTGNRFFELAEKTIAVFTEVNGEEQSELRSRLIILILLAVLLTALLWFLTARRLESFITNQNRAVKAISRGEYDYEIPDIVDDELGDLNVFTKEVAMSLREKTLAKEKAEKEKLKLEKQLLQAQKVESIGILAGGIAHDFNNILASILGFTSLALLKLPEDSPVNKYLASIEKAGLQAEKLTKQLLAFSRKQVLETRVVNLNDIVNDMTSMLSRLISEDIIMEFRPDEKLKNIRADTSQIGQILMNLTVNARDAMPNGGRLLIETANVQYSDEEKVQSSMLKPGAYAQIIVSDNGKGMSEDETKRIFEPFYTTKEKHKGTGLGLATVYGIVKQHKGYIMVYSEPGKGTAFKIYFPVVDDKKEEVVREKPVTSVKGSEKVLVVDDNASVCEIISETLRTYGYTVLTARNAREALRIVDESPYTFDLLITDVIMPHMNGRELAEKIRKKTGSIKIIFMSGYSDNFISSSEVASDSSMAFLSKPVSSGILTTKIREVLDS